MTGERGGAGGATAEAHGPLLAVEGLAVEFPTPRGVVRAVDGVTFAVQGGEALGIVGESGSGKTQTALSIMGLVPPPGRVAAGGVTFQGRDIAALSGDELRGLRGDAVSMVFQDPESALNPVFTVGSQIVETIRAHQSVPRARAWRLCEELLDEVGLPEPRRRARQYPFELSGGMRQRVGIAMAIANGPNLLIADEPTTALDVTVQAEVLDTLDRLRREHGMAMILISHDLAVVANVVDQACVMYAGRVVEHGPAERVFREPQHPYTMGLLASLPPLDRRVRRLHSIPGRPPDRLEVLPGCPFEPRCEFSREECWRAQPAPTGPEGHVAACVLTGEERDEAREVTSYDAA